jgi:hypothetical protein
MQLIVKDSANFSVDNFQGTAGLPNDTSASGKVVHDRCQKKQLLRVAAASGDRIDKVSDFADD